MARKLATAVGLCLTALMLSCAEDDTQEASGTASKGKAELIVLNPGHYHAALVQKTMYDQIDPNVHVYAPEGPELHEYLLRIEGFNNRTDDPTNWLELTYIGPDYLEMMVAEKPGNVVVLSGNNQKKTEAFNLRGFDLRVMDQVPIVPPVNQHNQRYLETKRQKMGHQLPEL